MNISFKFWLLHSLDIQLGYERNYKNQALERLNGTIANFPEKSKLSFTFMLNTSILNQKKSNF